MRTRGAALALLALLLASPASLAQPRGRWRQSQTDWIPRKLYPVIRELRGGPPAGEPEPSPRPGERALDEPAGRLPATAEPEPAAPRPAASEAPQPTQPPAPSAQASAPEPEASPHPRARRIAVALAALGLALAAVPILLLLLRRRGELVVVIDYPPELRGNFRVRVAREAERAPSERPTAAAGAARAPASAPKSTRTERFQVAREAQFPKLAAGRYWVVVEGQLCDASGERVQPCFAQRQARVERGRTLRVDFEFAPVTLPEVDEAGAVAQSPTRIEELRKRAEAQAALATRLRAATQAAPVVTSRYEILGEIGRGGMAVVYRARDTRLDRIVALKRISDSLREHPRAVDLLLREARSAAGLNHPHIVTIHDVDQQDGSYFITMEFLEGKPLHELLRLRGRFAARPVAHIGQQVVAGLAYAHERRIVHRDVKTANLFVTRGNVVKIMDFGLAKMVEEVRRRATMIGGTPSYMAPEQSRGLEVDGRADLYAFGVTLFELLTGRLPFEDGDVVQHHRETPPPDPRASAPDVPDALAELVLALLAKRPEDRPAAADVAARLRDVERGAPGAA